MKKWLKFFGVTVASAAASAVMSSMTTNPHELGNLKLMRDRAAAGALVAALTLIINNPLTSKTSEQKDVAALKRAARIAENKTVGEDQ